MDVAEVSALAAGNAAVSSGDKARLVGTYETFLTLLTSQLRNQNPLEPMDANKFTEQLVQYSSVEQQIKTNQNLEAMLAAMASASAMNLVGYVGTTVTARSSAAVLAGGEAAWSYTLDRAAPDSVITISDRSGTVLRSDPASLQAGTHNYVWNGTRADGSAALPGTYLIAISARDADGEPVPVTTRVNGVVESVDLSGPEPALRIGGATVPLSAVERVGSGP